MFEAVRARLRNLIRRDSVTAEMEEELRCRLEQSTELHGRRGMAPDDQRPAIRHQLPY